MSDINEMNVGVRWYVAHTYAGYENKVKASLEKIVENRGLGHLIFDIKIPVETVIEKNGDVEKEVEVKIFPSYVLVKMIMTEESWHAVRNITGVTGFVGPGSEPTPLTDEEIEMFSVEENKVEFKFEIGDKIEVVSGIFTGYSGTLQEISEDKKQLTILASTGRRDIPIMVDTKDVRIAE
jgi:transcriptional antiterminator NusG